MDIPVEGDDVIILELFERIVRLEVMFCFARFLLTAPESVHDALLYDPKETMSSLAKAHAFLAGASGASGMHATSLSCGVRPSNSTIW